MAVLHNNDLNQVTWEMRAMAGAPKFVESQALPDVDYAGFAAASAAARPPSKRSRRARRRLGERWPPTGRRCWTCTATPICRPSRRTPPGSRFKAATTAVLKGDEDRWGFVKKGIKTKAQELLPQRD